MRSTWRMSMKDKVVQTSTRKLVQTTQSQEVEYSQVRKLERAQILNPWKKDTARYLRTLLAQGNLRRQRLQGLSFKTPSIHDEGLPFPTKEVGNYSMILNIFDRDIKDKCVDVENVHVFVDESSHSSWTELFGKFGDLQEHELRGNSEEHYEKIMNVHTIHSSSPSWTRSVLSHDQVIQWTKAKVLV